jgi:hypothetical protein
MVLRTYRTRLTDQETGSTVQFLSAPGLVEPDVLDPLGQAEDIAAELGVEVLRPVTASELPTDLHVFVPGGGSRSERGQLYSEVLFAPVVIVEESPAVGRALGTLLAQVPSYAYLVEGHDSWALLVLYEATLIMVWLVAGPARGVRDAAEAAARKVSEPVFEERFQEFVERRQYRRRRHRDRDQED